MCERVTIDLALHHPEAICRVTSMAITRSFVGRFIGSEEEPPPEVSAWLDLRQFESLEDYLRACRKASKGGIHADVKRAYREGYTFSEFVRQNHPREVEDIHRSCPERQGKPMRDAYLQDMGPEPVQPIPVTMPTCAEHWVRHFACQDKDNKVVAYITMRRVGTFSHYSMIIGHGEHLRHGVMGALHAQVVGYAMQRIGPWAGLSGIMYAGMFQGREGLVHWKKKALFVPVRLML